MIALITTVLEFIMWAWERMSGRAKKRLQDKRVELEKESRRAQLDGELDTLRRVRGEIEEIDRKLFTGDY